MQPELEMIVERLHKAQTLEALQDETFALKDHYQIDHVVYHWVNSTGEQYGCGTYPPEWVELYIKRDYIRVDPVIVGCFQRFHPVDWKRLDWSGKHAREFLREAVSLGVGNQGFSVPVRGPNGQFALFSVSTTCDDDTWADFTEKNMRDLILIAHFFNQKALEFESNLKEPASRMLSPREVDAITYLAMGYSRAQVAETLSISENTLRVYIESARSKLGAANTTHAVACALSRGLIVV